MSDQENPLHTTEEIEAEWGELALLRSSVAPAEQHSSVMRQAISLAIMVIERRFTPAQVERLIPPTSQREFAIASHAARWLVSKGAEKASVWARQEFADRFAE